MIRAVAAVLAAALLMAGVSPVAAQQNTRAAGRVVRVTAAGDTLPVAGLRVLLHRVGDDAQGPLDSAVTGATGYFAVRFASDTTALFLLSARYAGLEYFSTPLATDPARPDTAVIIAVADTSAAQRVSVAVRQIVITRPEDDGTRSVLDLIELANRGPATRVGRDTLSPSWAMPLPAGIIEFHAGPGDAGLDAVERQGDVLAVLSPIPPGPKQILVQYAIPAGVDEFTLPLSDPVGQLEILVEESDAVVEGGNMALAESREVEGRTFHRWSGAPDAGVIGIALPDTGRATRWTLIGLVATIGLGLAVAAWLTRRATVPSLARAAGPDHVALADAAAELDSRYRGREAETPPEEWRAYQEERARLKAAITAALAEGDRRT